MFARQPRHQNRATDTKKVTKAHGSKEASTATQSSSGAVGTSQSRTDIFHPSSELGQLLRSNHSPTDAQLLVIKSLQIHLQNEAQNSGRLSAQKCQEIQQHENAIFRIRAEMAQLEQQARKARQDLSYAASLLSPIRVLPAEIIGEIFVACLDVEIAINQLPMPLVLCRVCSAWRAIARSTPALWSQLVVPRPISIQELTKLASKWFNLAGEVPLSVSVVIGHPSVVMSSPGIITRTDDAAPSVWERIENLHIRVKFWRQVEDILRNMPSVMTGLKNLSLQAEDFTTDMPKNLSVSTLRKFRIVPVPSKFSRVCMVQQDLDFQLPWTQLTHLFLGHVAISAAIWRAFFQTCRRLVQGSFLLSGETTESNQTDVVSLPALHSLEIAFVKNGDWSVLRGFSFPALQYLRLGSLEGLGSWDDASFMNLQTSRLKILTLFRIKVLFPSLANYLRQSPAIESLLVHLPSSYSLLFKALKIVGDEEEGIPSAVTHSDVLLPNLKKLSVYQWNSFDRKMDLDIKTLSDMVKIRFSPKAERHSAPAGKCLQRIAIWQSRPGLALGLLRSDLRREKKEGLVLEVGVSRDGYHYVPKLDWY